MRPRFLGDVLLTLPAIGVLRRAWPDAHLTYYTEPAWVSLVERQAGIDRVISIPRGPRAIRFLGSLRGEHYDLWIDWFGNPRTALMTACARAGTKLGLPVGFRRRAYTVVAQLGPGPIPAHRFYAETLRAVGINSSSDLSLPRWQASVEASSEAKRFLAAHDLDGRLVAIAPGASHSAKRWPVERFVSVARSLQTNGARVLFLLGPKEDGIREEVLRSCTNGTVVLDTAPIAVVGAVLSRCAAFLGNDAGLLHLARAVGTRAVGVFGPGIPEIWFPDRRKGKDELIHKEFACSRCGLDVCPGLGWRCMLEIPPEQVTAAMERVLR